MTNPNKDGWIRHKGSKQPVSDDVRVEYRMRSGVKSKDFAGSLAWNHENDRSDIMAYKPIYSGFQPEPMIEAPKKPEALVLDYSPSLHIQSFGRAYRHEGDPRTMRDRIREIDAASKEEEARHCAAMDEYDEERTSLVAKLKAEGFALIQGEDESAQQDIAKQDMSDWRNWQKGDVVECVSHNNEWSRKFEIGERGIVEDLNTDATKLFVNIDGWNVTPSDFKWCSRPTS